MDVDNNANESQSALILLSIFKISSLKVLFIESYNSRLSFNPSSNSGNLLFIYSKVFLYTII